MARPSKYEPERVNTICEAISRGATNEAAAARGGIALDTFYEWLKSKPEFSERVKEARKDFENWELEGILKDAKKSLKTLICGEKYTETRTEYEQDPKNPNEPRIRKQIITEKVIPPSPTAVIFALVNRDPDHWKNRSTQELMGKIQTDDEISVSLASVPDDLLAKVLEAIKKGNGGI